MQEIVIPDSWRDRLEALAGRRRDLYVIAGIVGAALVIAIFSLSHRSAAAVAAPARPAPVAAPSPAATPIYVHVAGAVRRPGLYELPPGTRVAQAIEAAGGAVHRADLDQLNLAAILTDASKVEVPVRGAIVSPTSAPVPGATASTVDLNTADAAALETIPGVGPVTAAAILQKRAELGGFESIDQLLDVTGIGPATLESIRPYISL